MEQGIFAISEKNQRLQIFLNKMCIKSDSGSSHVILKYWYYKHIHIYTKMVRI